MSREHSQDLFQTLEEGRRFCKEIYTGAPVNLKRGSSVDGVHLGQVLIDSNPDRTIQSALKMFPQLPTMLYSTYEPNKLKRSGIFYSEGILFRINVYTDPHKKSRIETFTKIIPTNKMREARAHRPRYETLTILEYLHAQRNFIEALKRDLSGNLFLCLEVGKSGSSSGQTKSITKTEIEKIITRFGYFEKIVHASGERESARSSRFTILDRPGGEPIPGVVLSLELNWGKNGKMASLSLKKEESKKAL